VKQMYTSQDFCKYLQLLNSFGNEISAEGFTQYFSRGIILHELTYAKIAKMFNLNRTIADRCIQGKRNVAEACRVTILKVFKKMTEQKLEELN
jgi:hypothetical protein